MKQNNKQTMKWNEKDYNYCFGIQCEGLKILLFFVCLFLKEKQPVFQF